MIKLDLYVVAKKYINNMHEPQKVFDLYTKYYDLIYIKKIIKSLITFNKIFTYI
jgi:hypothetical protein